MRFISLIVGGLSLLMLNASTAYADACTSALGNVFTPAQEIGLCTRLGRAYSTDFGFIAGKTIALQEATAASACSGSVTANGTTPVVITTTCSQTGQRLFLTKTSTSTVNGSCYQSAVSNGVSTTITCLASDTGTYNWMIIHEAP
jgi:hypothetical protein